MEPVRIDKDINPGRETRYYVLNNGHTLRWEMWYTQSGRKGEVWAQDGEGSIYCSTEVFDPEIWDWTRA